MAVTHEKKCSNVSVKAEKKDAASKETSQVPKIEDIPHVHGLKDTHNAF